MTFLTLYLAAIALATPPPDCSRPLSTSGQTRVFTNADLDRIAACRRETGARSEPDAPPTTGPSQGSVKRTTRAPATETPGHESARGLDALEADWRARWRSVDQKVRRLRREAAELRQEADEASRDPKKKPTGRRSAAMLISRAGTLEAEATDIEDEFHALARREGALPGWLRPK